MGLDIRKMDAETSYFVSACGHCDESDETDLAARVRQGWLERNEREGAYTRVALLDEKPVGFIHAIPVEWMKTGIEGKGVYVIPCLNVEKEGLGKGVGTALVAVIEGEVRMRGSKGLAVHAYRGEFPFMPAEFFESLGFEVVLERPTKDQGAAQHLPTEVLLLRSWDPSVETPALVDRTYTFEPVEGKVVIDLFWSPFCLTSATEAERVRRVSSEFGGAVVLNEHSTSDGEWLEKCRTPRAIYINGVEIGWGYDAPEEGIREAVQKALDHL